MKVKPKAIYSISELSQLSGLSWKRTKRLLQKAGVWKKGRVFLSDLKQELPEFWESCLDCEAVRALDDDGH